MIKIYDTHSDGTSYSFESLIFSGGEPHIKISEDVVEKIRNNKIWIDVRGNKPEEFLKLLALINAVKACKPRKLGLFIPYFPGARQDRKELGVCFTLQMYVKIIKSLNLDYICTFDPHSDVLAGMLDVDIIPQSSVIGLDRKYDGVICPDAGAEKRVRKFCDHHNIGNIIFCHKARNMGTGKLSEFEVGILSNLYGKYLILDDICDGGATFVKLVEKFQDNGFINVIFDLAVSHGIFSKGFGILSACFEKIITTDSFVGDGQLASIIRYPLFYEANYRMVNNL